MSGPVRLQRRHIISFCLLAFCLLIGWLCGCGHQSNKASSTSDQQTASTTAFTAGELLNELRLRAARNRLAHDKSNVFPPTAEIDSERVAPRKPSFPKGDPRLLNIS